MGKGGMMDNKIEIIDSVKRFIVVIFTEIVFFAIELALLYIVYMKNCTIAEFMSLVSNPLNPITILILGIGGMGGGYIGIKLWENLKTNGTQDTKSTEVKPQ